MNLATHAGLIAGTSVLTIADRTAGDLDSVIDGIINDSATISGDDAYSMEGLFIYGYTNTDADDFGPGVGKPPSDSKATPAVPLGVRLQLHQRFLR